MARITVRCVYFFKVCVCVCVCVCVSLIDLNVRPVSCVGTIGVRVHTGSVGVCLGLGAQPPEVVANVEQLSVDAVFYTLAVQVNSEASTGQYNGRMVLKTLQEVHCTHTHKLMLTHVHTLMYTHMQHVLCTLGV